MPLFGVAAFLSDNRRRAIDFLDAGDDKADSAKLPSSHKLRDDQQKATSRGVNGLGGKLDVSV